MYFFDKFAALPRRILLALSFLGVAAGQWAIGKLLDGLQQQLPDTARVVKATQTILAFVPGLWLLLIAFGIVLPLIIDWTKARLGFSTDADTAWRERNQLEIYYIACRAVGVTPTMEVPQGAALSMMRLLGDAVRDKQLSAIGDIDGDRARGGGIMAQIPHWALAQFALASKNDRLFKFANDWKPMADADFGKLLNVSNIHLNVDDLASDQLALTLRCFNGSPGRASISHVVGPIQYRVKNELFRTIGVPAFKDRSSTLASANWGEEFFVSLVLAVPTELAREISHRLEEGESVELGFQNMIVSCDLGPPICRYNVHLKFWNAVKFQKLGAKVFASGFTFSVNIDITGEH